MIDFDKHAARELALHADNNADAYQRYTVWVIRNLYRKQQRGQYDPAKAIKAWYNILSPIAQHYHRLHCSPRDRWYDIFPAAVRWAAAAELEERWRDELHDPTEVQS